MKIVKPKLKLPLFILLVFASFSLFSVEWKASLGTDTFSNYTDDANILSAGLTAKGDLQLTKKLFMIGELSLKWRTGRAQSWYGYDANKDGFSFKNAYVLFKPINSVNIQAGAISTNYLRSPNLITATFPGVRESLIINNNSFSIELSAFQAIPTSSSMNTSRSEKEEVPFFGVENIKLSYSKRNIEVSAQAGHFQFKNLPSKVAYESSFLGNDVDVQYESNSNFKYEFNGFTIGSEIKVNITDTIKLGALYTRVENSEAAYAHNRGEMLKIYSEIIAGNNIITPFAGTYFNESDLTPAYYNSWKFGHNNRQGYFAGASCNFTKYGFKVSGQFVDADLIDTELDLVNSREQYIFLKLETNFKGL